MGAGVDQGTANVNKCDLKNVIAVASQCIHTSMHKSLRLCNK